MIQVDAALESPGADGAERGRAADLFEVPAVAEGFLADGQEAFGQLDAFQEAALVEDGPADVGEGVGEADLLEEGVPLVQRNLLADLAVLGHVVPEGEDFVAEDAAAFADRHFGGKVLGVEELLPVGRVGQTVVVVPDVMGQVFGSGGRRDVEDLFEGHVRSS